MRIDFEVVITVVCNRDRKRRRYGHNSAIGPVAVAAASLTVSYTISRVLVLLSRNTALIEGRPVEMNGRSPAQ